MPEQAEQPTAEPTTTTSTTTLSWRSWPLRDEPWHGALLAGGLLLLGVLAFVVSGRLYLGLLAIAAMAAALWRFFLPVEFKLSAQGVEQRVLGRRRHVAWDAVGRYELLASGALLLPEHDPSPLASFRGLYLPFADRGEQVAQLVEVYLGKADGSRAEVPRRQEVVQPH